MIEIKLNSIGDTLINKDVSNKDAPVNSHMNRHNHCNGFFHKHKASETHDRHVCDKCNFFFEVPKEVDTLEKLENYCEENMKPKPKRLHYLIKDKEKGLVETGKYLNLGLKPGKPLIINSEKFREMINDQLGLGIEKSGYFKVKNEKITFRFNNGSTTVTNGDNTSLLVQTNESLPEEERTLLMGEILKFRGIYFRVSE